MKRLKTKWSSVIAKLLWALLLVSLYQPSLHASGIIASTQKLEKQNLENIKTSAQALKKTVEDYRNKLQTDWKNVSGKVTSSGDAISGLMEQFQGVFDGDFESLKDFDRDKIKEIFDNAKSLVDDATKEGKDFKEFLNNMHSQTEELVQNVKNIITLRYTAPVGIRSSQLMFDLGVDDLIYARAETKGSVAINVHATWTLPWTISDGSGGNTLNFTGENVILRGEGSSKIYVSDGDKHTDKPVRIPLSKNKVYLEVDPESFVEIDCNGFKQMYLKGRVCFSSEIITNAKNPAAEVTASFSAKFDDLRNIIFEAQIDDPFKVKATDDVIYTGYGLVADFSTKENGKNFAFPKYYESPFKEGDEAYWTGFAIKKLEVDLTKEFPDFPLDKVSANNMLIDETGVSGWFTASMSFGKDNKQSGTTSGGTDTQSNTNSGTTTSNPKKQKNSTIEGEFSEIAIGLSHGDIVAGSVEGTVTVKPLKDKNGTPLTLALKGTIGSNPVNHHLEFDITTTIKKDLTYKLPFLETTNVTVGQGTYISYSKSYETATNEEGVLVETGNVNRVFTLSLNGGLDIDNKLLKVDGLKFEGLKFTSAKPHFHSGNFSLNGVDVPCLHGLPFGLKTVGVGSKDGDAILTPEVYLSLIDKDSDDDAKQGVSVDAAFDVIAGVDEDKKLDWFIKGLKLKKIDVDVSYSAFRLKGVIEGYNDDPMYGDGFHGALGFSMEVPPISADAETYFGKTNYIDGTQTTKEKYRYWYAYANVDLPPGTIIFPPAVFLGSVSLTVYKGLRYDYDKKLCKITKVYPDKTKGFGFKAGIGFYVAQDNLINAKATMGLDFSESGGISNVNLNGFVGVLAKNGVDEAFLLGEIGVKYDFKNKIFSLDTEVTPGGAISKFVSGKADINLRTYPESWYCNIGKVDDPNYLQFLGIATAKSYMMFGDSVPTYLPPLDPAISAMFDVTQSTATSSDHTGELSDGTGFAFGIALGVEAHLNAFIYADLAFKGGTDLLVVRRPNMLCGDSKYRASGRVYVYLNGAAGIKFRKKKFEVVGFSAAADLEGEIPKPIYIEGKVAFQYRLLGGVLKGKARAKYKTGTSCSWTSDGKPKYQSYDGVILDEEEIQSGESGATESENAREYNTDGGDDLGE